MIIHMYKNVLIFLHLPEIRKRIKIFKEKIAEIFFIGIVIFVVATGKSYCLPAISGITGNLRNGSTVNITGTGFGNSGPSIAIYEEFENGTTGEDIDLTATIGEWTSKHPTSPTYAAISHSQPHGASVYIGNDNSDGLNFFKTFSSPCTEGFMSYWIKIPEGTYFPAASSLQTLPDNSCWKFLWFYYGELGFGDDGAADLCFPTYAGKDTLIIWGNDGGPGYSWSQPNTWPDYHGDLKITDWWSWNNWMRITFWFKANESDVTLNGIYYWQIIVENTSYQENMITNNPVFSFTLDADKRKFDRMSIPGWIRPNGGTNINPIYDDIYIAIGQNSAARIEIGNSSTYANCTNLTICTVNTWSNTSISAVLRRGTLPACETVYLFVVDSDGNVNTQGYPIRIVTGAGEPPCPPTGLKVKQ